MSNIKAKQFVIRSLESILVVGFILFEELIWNVFAKPIFQYFKSLVVLSSLRKTFLGMNRYFLLAVFIVILGIAEIMGFLSGFLILNGYIFPGVFVYALKIPVAAFTFWLFDVTKDQLMTFDWLKTSYEYIMSLVEKFTNSAIHVYIKARIIALKVKIRQVAQKYFGKEGFAASVKTHYMIFNSYVVNNYKIWFSFSVSKIKGSIASQSRTK